MAYLPQVDDNTTRANTVVGSSANSTNCGVPSSFNSPDDGSAWIDFNGTYWTITSNTLHNSDTNAPGSSPILGALYRSSAGNCIDGKIVWNGVSSTNGGGGVCRFNTTSGGNGYSGILYSPSSNPKFYFYKCVNGTTTFVGSSSGYATGVTTPTNYTVEFIFAQIDSLTTQLTLNLYAQAAPTVVIATQTLTDTTASLQSLSGAMGLGMNGGSILSHPRLYAGGGALTAGTATLINAYKSKAYPQMTAPSGGTPPRTYQWYLSTTSGFTPGAGNLVSGATSLTPSFTGLAARTTYYAICRTTDATSATADSNQLSFTTIKSTARIIGFSGDSITRGFGVPNLTLRASTRCIAYMRAAGVDVVEVNAGVDGSTSQGWQQAQPNYTAAVSAFAAAEVDTVHIMIGTYDAKVSGQTTDTNYLTYLTSQVNGWLGLGYKVVISYSPYNNIAVTSPTWDSTSLTALLTYEVKIDTLPNGTTKFAGDKTAYTFFLANTNELGDGTHPNQQGSDDLGRLWANAMMANVPGLAPVASALRIGRIGIWLGIGI
jgi:lysophospholipase L1-like esterase